MPLFSGMLNQFLNISRIYCVHHIEEVLARRLSSLWDLVREEAHELLNLLHVRPEVLYGELIIVRNCDELDIAQRKKCFLLSQHLTKEVYHKCFYVKRKLTFVDHDLGRHIHLKLIAEVIQKIIFRLETMC